MVSRGAERCALSNSESDSDCGPSDPRSSKRNKALQVHFRDICQAQGLVHGTTRGRSTSCRAPPPRYMTMPARRSIPNVTRSTAVQTSPDLKTRYQTFPLERKKGHGVKRTAVVESCPEQNNGVLGDGNEAVEEVKRAGNVHRTRVLLHTPHCNAGLDPDLGPTDAIADQSDTKAEGATRGDGTKPKGLANECEAGAGQQTNCTPASSAAAQPLQDRGEGSKVTGPIAWTSLTQVECLESPSAWRRCEEDGGHLNGLQTQSQTLPRAATTQSHPQTHRHTCVTMDTRAKRGPGASAGVRPAVGQTCQKVSPSLGADAEVKGRLQAMESLISSSQETIKVLLGVIQELERGEAQRGGLSYRTGQDTANCDTCRNSACIIYSVELDFKQQEDKLQPLIRRLNPLEESSCPPSLPYRAEVFTSTPKRRGRAEPKKHARWRLWFL